MKKINKKGSNRNLKNYLYIVGAIIGFLAFTFSAICVKVNSILIVSGIIGMAVMMYCISKLVS